MDLLDRMRANPAGNWAIRDVGVVCQHAGLRFTAPSGGGSHDKVSHPSRRDILTIPYARPVKPVYIRKLVAFIDSLGAPDGPP